jgi:hypothetical protein
LSHWRHCWGGSSIPIRHLSETCLAKPCFVLIADPRFWLGRGFGFSALAMLQVRMIVLQLREIH